MKKNSFLDFVLGTLIVFCSLCIFAAEIPNLFAVDSAGCTKNGCTLTAGNRCQDGCVGEGCKCKKVGTAENPECSCVK